MTIADQNEPGCEPISVLLIEGDPDWRLLAELQLSMSPVFEVRTTTATFEAGIEALAAEAHDMVLVGLGTPSSLEHGLLRALRQAAGEAPVVAASAATPSTGLNPMWLGDIVCLDKMAILSLADELSQHVPDRRVTAAA